jgi:hypothetical protein
MSGGKYHKDGGFKNLEDVCSMFLRIVTHFLENRVIVVYLRHARTVTSKHASNNRITD